MVSNWSNKFYDHSDKVFKDKQITHFLDGGGYSLIGEYKASFKRRMGVGKDGNQVPFLKFIFDENSKIENGKYVPLTISVGITTKVIEGTETRYMLNDSRIKHFRPIDLVSNDDFFISTVNGKIYERKNKKFSQVELDVLYNRVLKVHLSDVVTLSGIYRRTKMFVYRRLPSLLLAALAWAFGWLTFFIKNDRYIYNVIKERYLNRRGDTEKVIDPATVGPNIDFFGYKVSIWTLYTYSFLVIIAYLIWRKSLNNFISKDGLSSLFGIPFAIFSIVTYDRLIPGFLKSAIKYSSIRSYDLKYTGIKLKV